VSRPTVLNSVQQLGHGFAHLRLRAIGFDQDGQTRDKQWFAQTTPALLGMLEELNPAAAFAISRWRKAAELAARNLGWALRRVWVTINDPSNGTGAPKRKDLGNGPWASRGAAMYWARAERDFWRLLHHGDYTAQDIVFFHHARDVFDEITDAPSIQPRRERARARARGLIFAGRPQPVTSLPKETHDTPTAV
jgi:CRISPR system Cascade subunit CasA